MTENSPQRMISRLASELELPPRGVGAVLELLQAGNTVPFIARYRKEATGNLDEVQIRAVEERHLYLTELEQRREAVLSSILEQGKLTDELRARVLACDTKSELEDLYLPYRPKRRTRASIARERGLSPLADRMLAQPRSGDPIREAQAFVDVAKELPDVDAALAGARDIVAEFVSEDARVRALVREVFRRDGLLHVKAAKKGLADGTKYADYADHSERAGRVPSHRFLAARRGEREEVLRVRVEVDADRLIPRLLLHFGHRQGTPFARQLEEAVRDGFKRLIGPSIEKETLAAMKERADRTAVDVFARNLHHLLLAPPLGGEAVVGIDPGLRTGCKCAAVDATGRFLANTTIFPHEGASSAVRAKAAQTLLAFVRAHRPRAIAVGNGTAGRETERFTRDTLRAAGLTDILVVLVSESGASIYSASDVAREEFPDLDLTVRGAISIARRLQDPLAELVKVDPKAIGVGQYQHDVDQTLLARKLDEVVESAVNQVGVELNTASAALLARVAGVGPKLALRVVAHRDAHGRFRSRRALLDVAGLGPKKFEQAAGFLRVRGGDHPLDASAVHPERYTLVARMAREIGVPLADLVGADALVERIDLQRYVSAEVGEPTLRDILAELKKPGRDPRERFEASHFEDNVRSIDDLEVGMRLSGVVTNVTNFGAFVDIGVHRDGLVHVSKLTDGFVRDPNEVVHPGQNIKVWVTDVERARGRISLSAQTTFQAEGEAGGGRRAGSSSNDKPPQTRSDSSRPARSRPSAPRAPRPPKTGGGFRNNPFAGLLKDDDR